MPKIFKRKPIYIIIPILILIFGSVFLLVKESESGIDWEVMSGPPAMGDAILEDVVAYYDTNDKVYYVWAVGGRPRKSGGEYAVIFTYDGKNNTWIAEEIKSQDMLRAVTLEYIGGPTPYRLWAVGDNGAIFYSADGLNWAVQQNSGVNWTDKDLYDVSSINDQEIWAVGEAGKVLATSDAGLNWTESFAGANNLYAAHMKASNDGKAVGENGSLCIFNGAWSCVQVKDMGQNPISEALTDLYYSAPGSMIATMSLLDGTGRLCTFSDFGAPGWLMFGCPIVAPNAINALSVLVDNTYFTAGDSGQIWDNSSGEHSTQVPANLKGISAVTENHAWAVGEDSTIIKMSPGNVVGWGWFGADDDGSGGNTSPLGWVSFSCANQNTCEKENFTYGVNIKKKTTADCTDPSEPLDVGALSGFAWVGKDDSSETIDSPVCDLGTCSGGICSNNPAKACSLDSDCYLCSNKLDIECVSDLECQSCITNPASCFQTGWLSFDRYNAGYISPGALFANVPGCPYLFWDPGYTCASTPVVTGDPALDKYYIESPCKIINWGGLPDRYHGMAFFDYASYAVTGWARLQLGTCSKNPDIGCYQDEDCPDGPLHYDDPSYPGVWENEYCIYRELGLCKYDICTGGFCEKTPTEPCSQNSDCYNKNVCNNPNWDCQANTCDYCNLDLATPVCTRVGNLCTSDADCLNDCPITSEFGFCDKDNKCPSNNCVKSDYTQGWVKLRWSKDDGTSNQVGVGLDIEPAEMGKAYAECNACITVDPDGGEDHPDTYDGDEYLECRICDGAFDVPNDPKQYACNKCEGLYNCGTGRCSDDLSKTCLINLDTQKDRCFIESGGLATCQQAGRCTLKEVDGITPNALAFDPCFNDGNCGNGTCELMSSPIPANTCNSCEICDPYGISIDIDEGTWYGQAWSEDYGWLDMDLVGSYTTPWIRTLFSDIYAKGSIGSPRITKAPGYRNKLLDCNAAYLVISSTKIINFCTSSYVDEFFRLNPSPGKPSTNPYNPYLIQGYRAFDAPTESAPITVLGSIDYNAITAKAEAATTFDLASEDQSSEVWPTGSVDLDGKVYWVQGQDFTIDAALTFNNGNIDGSGMIVVDGDLYINADMTYEIPAQVDNIKKLASVGFYVKGNITVHEDVDVVVGNFYTLGSFISETKGSPTTDTQLQISGLLIANKFDFKRQFLGTIDIPQPSELITYDGRVNANPPPGFRDVSQALPRIIEVAP